jgi:integrase
VIGYLPGDRPKLKESYDEYELSCWDTGQVAEAPEVYYREQIERFLGRSSSMKETSHPEPARRPEVAMTLREFVGTPEKPGAFWACSRAKSESRREAYWRVIRRVGPLADRPMASLRSSDFVAWFEERMACVACTGRAIDGGVRPGVDIEWRSLVPRLDASGFEGAEQCEFHQTPVGLATYEMDRVTLSAVFKAAAGAAAVERFGEPLVTYNPVPEKARLLDTRSIAFAKSEGEELRFGLSEEQVHRLTEASPPRYKAIPFTAAFTLNRAGQELTGMNIGHFSRVMADNGRMVGCLELREFHRRRKGGGRVMSEHGKTPKTTRTVFLPAFVADIIEEHIRSFRSAPSPSCPACSAGTQHWGGPLRDDPGRNPHKGCDFAADAPLFVGEDGQRLNPDWYVKRVWHQVCERAGLTKETLGWKPQLKHSRSTGATLHLNHGTSMAEVMRLGGWSSEQMITAHYERQSRATRASQVAGWGDVDESGTGLEFELRRLRREVERLRTICHASGVDPDQPLQPPPEKDSGRKFSDDDAIAAVIDIARKGDAPRAVLESLGVAAAKKNYERLASVCARRGIPVIPSTKRQLPDGRKPTELAEWHAVVREWSQSEPDVEAG